MQASTLADLCSISQQGMLCSLRHITQPMPFDFASTMGSGYRGSETATETCRETCMASNSASDCKLAVTLVGWVAGVWAGVDWQVVEWGEDLQVE